MDGRDGFITLQTGLAWVYMRSHEFNAAVERASIWPLRVALAKFNEGRGRRPLPLFDSVVDAWHSLRDCAQQEDIELWGMPYDILTDERLSYGPHGRIPRDIIPRLDLDERPGGPALILDRPMHRQLWMQVAIEKRILTLFPLVASGFAFTEGRLESLAKVPETRTNRIITQAVKHEFPKGDWADYTMKERFSKINGWVGANIEGVGDTKAKVSPSSVDRYFKQLEGKR